MWYVCRSKGTLHWYNVMSTEREQVVSRSERAVGSTSAAVLGLRLIRIEVDAAWHGIVVRSCPVPTCGATRTLNRRWSPKLRSVEDLFCHFLESFAHSDRSLCRSFDEKGVHTTGESLAFGC